MKYLKKNFPARRRKIDFRRFGNLPRFRYRDYKPVVSIEENPYEIVLQAAPLLFKKIMQQESEKKEIYGI